MSKTVPELGETIAQLFGAPALIAVHETSPLVRKPTRRIAETMRFGQRVLPLGLEDFS
jgi:hypothetical protein